MGKVWRLLPWALMGMWGLLLIRLAISGEYLNYVKPELKWWLVVAGALALIATVYKLRDGSLADHDHGGKSVGLLLLIPIIAVGLFIPSAGPWLAQKQQTQRITQVKRDSGNLPPSGVADVRLDDYFLRSMQQDKEIEGRTVRLVGFVSPRKDGSGWDVSRLRASCCVADALTVKARVLGADAPPEGIWVEVEGLYQPRQGDDAVVKATKVTPIPVPAQPLLT